MGGLIAGPFLGPIDGLSAGLASEGTQPILSQKFQNELHNKTYRIGFENGFKQGQIYREQLRNELTPLPFEEKVALCVYLNQQRQWCGDLKIVLQDFITHQADWGVYDLPKEVAESALAYLQQHKYQRTITLIKAYYKTQYGIAAWQSFDQIAILLIQIRTQRKKGYVPTVHYLKTLQSISDLLQQWIDTHSS